MELANATMRLSAFAAAVLLAGCGPPDRRHGESYTPLPDDVVAAWTKAGGQIGTISMWGNANLVTEIGGTEPHGREGESVPAFVFHEWEPGITGRLPQPQTPFGLCLDRFTDDDLKDLACFQHLKKLALTFSPLTGVGFKDLGGLEELQSLSLNKTKLTDAGLKEVARLKGLRTLDISSTEIGDSGLQELTGLRELTELSMGWTKATDAGLWEVARLSALDTLDINGIPATSKGLRYLVAIKGLRKLGLVNVRLTDADLKTVAALKGLGTRSAWHPSHEQGRRRTPASVAECED
jgi:hypothetical protein